MAHTVGCRAKNWSCCLESVGQRFPGSGSVRLAGHGRVQQRAFAEGAASAARTQLPPIEGSRTNGSAPDSDFPFRPPSNIERIRHVGPPFGFLPARLLPVQRASYLEPIRRLRGSSNYEDHRLVCRSRGDTFRISNLEFKRPRGGRPSRSIGRPTCEGGSCSKSESWRNLLEQQRPNGRFDRTDA